MRWLAWAVFGWLALAAVVLLDSVSSQARASYFPAEFSATTKMLFVVLVIWGVAIFAASAVAVSWAPEGSGISASLTVGRVLVAWVIVTVVGQAALAISPNWSAPLVPLAAALPTVAVPLYLMRRVSTNLPWAQLAVAVVAGAFVAPLIDNGITVIGRAALGFVDELPPNTGGFSEPRLIFFWALLIPAGEELAK